MVRALLRASPTAEVVVGRRRVGSSGQWLFGAAVVLGSGRFGQRSLGNAGSSSFVRPSSGFSMLRFWTDELTDTHPGRAKQILRSHPEVRRLIGRNRWTAAIAFTLVAAQIATAALFGRLGPSSWLLLLATAWCFGAFANHALYVVIHEASHDLVFSNRKANKALAIFCDAVNVVPGAISFRIYHLKHHAHLGEEAFDADVPSGWERRLVGNSRVRKAIWLFMFPVVQVLRALRVGGAGILDKWAIANAVCNIFVDVVVFDKLGAGALLYLLASFWFALSLHPLGARWIQEHFTTDPSQETSSYYGPLNAVALNMGYHNEHHDLPSIPWNRLPTLRAIAPELYEARKSHGSWALLVWQFVMDRRYSLCSRVVRERAADNGRESAGRADSARAPAVAQPSVVMSQSSPTSP
jgi:sphingolipid 4-desaturase/C4-monooxygenase